jgi:CubicO group peptidase (beta-lactamase class C family)
MQMDRRRLMAGAGLAATVPAAAAATQAAAPAATSLDQALQPYLGRFNLPALVAAVVIAGELTACGAVGTRRVGTDTPVKIADRFHIGSDTKAMTALLAAMLVENGKLGWGTTVADIFPELGDKMAANVGTVRLDQLLSHTSGIPSDNDFHENLLFNSFSQTRVNLDGLRYWVVKGLLPQPLQSPPGERFAYANMGYLLAGAMIERVTGSTWEELVATRIFDPLGLASAGFGPQAQLGRVDAPLGHRPLEDGTLKAMLSGPNGDNPEILGPAGTVHLSILDFAAWASWNSGQGRRGPALVSADTLRKLQTPVVDIPARPDTKPGTPPPGRYGLGWVTVQLPFAAEPFLFHGGSNELNLAYVMFEPKADFAMVLATNVGGDKADNALRALGEELYRRFAAPR